MFFSFLLGADVYGKWGSKQAERESTPFLSLPPPTPTVETPECVADYKKERGKLQNSTSSSLYPLAPQDPYGAAGGTHLAPGE